MIQSDFKMIRIGLVSCGKKKHSTAQIAAQLYTSNLFRSAKKYAENNYDLWFILSAKNYLLEPNSVIEPYDENLSEMTSAQRLKWAKRVYEQITSRYPNPSSCRIYFHAGEFYRRKLIEMLRKKEYICEEPLKGMRIGEQIAWYSNSGQQTL